MNRSAALDAAKAAVADRPNQYGKPEQSFDRIAALWQTHLLSRTFDADRDELSATDVALMLALVKIARLEADPTHADSWIDLAGYAGCGAEVSGAVTPKTNAMTEPRCGICEKFIHSCECPHRPAQNSDLVDDVLQHKCSMGWFHICVNHPETKFGFTVGDKVTSINNLDATVTGFTASHLKVDWYDGSKGEWLPSHFRKRS